MVFVLGRLTVSGMSEGSGVGGVDLKAIAIWFKWWCNDLVGSWVAHCVAASGARLRKDSCYGQQEPERAGRR